MKKQLKFITISAFILFSLISCDNDATSGILSNIVDAEPKESFTISAVAFDTTNGKYFANENSGLYEIDLAAGTNDFLFNLLSSDDYQNVTEMYNDNTTLYFIANPADGKSLYYMETVTQSTPTLLSVDNDTAVLPVSLTSNGYLVINNTTDGKYQIKPVSTGVSSATATDLFDNSLSPSTIVPLDDDYTIFQTVSENTASSTGYYYDYYLYDGASPVTSIGVDNEYKIVSGIKVGSDYFLILSDATLIKYDGSSITTMYEQSDSTTYSINTASSNLYFEANNYLVTIDSSNNVLAYDLSDTVTTTGFAELSEGFASIINNTSSIVGSYKVTDNQFYIATSDEGYYRLDITDPSILLDEDISTNSSGTKIELTSV